MRALHSSGKDTFIRLLGGRMRAGRRRCGGRFRFAMCARIKFFERKKRVVRGASMCVRACVRFARAKNVCFIRTVECASSASSRTMCVCVHLLGACVRFRTRARIIYATRFSKDLRAPHHRHTHTHKKSRAQAERFIEIVSAGHQTE